jgi:hypothetical protein
VHSTRFDKWVEAAKNNRSMAGLLLIGAVVAAVAMFTNAVRDIRHFVVEFRAAQPETPVWFKRLSHEPIVVGQSMAGLSIGQTEQETLQMLGQPTEFITSFGRGENVSSLEGYLGPVLTYGLSYIHGRVRFHVHTDRDTRRVKDMFLTCEPPLDPRCRSLPTVKGVGIGVTKSFLLREFGAPKATREDTYCFRFLSVREDHPQNDATAYSYPGITFSACDATGLIYRIEIQPRQAANKK